MWGFWKQERRCLVSGRRNRVEAAGLAAGIDTLAFAGLGSPGRETMEVHDGVFQCFFLVMLVLFERYPKIVT